MGVLAYLEHVRTKPKAVRLRIALVLTVTLWVVIILMWWIAFSGNPRDDMMPITEVTSPWQGFAHTMVRAGGEVKEMYGAFVGAIGSIDVSSTVEYNQEDRSKILNNDVPVAKDGNWEAELGGVLLENNEAGKTGSNP